MFYRIKQFLLGLTAKVSSEDIKFLKQYLSQKEQQLFFQLSKADQKHSLNVAYGCASRSTNLQLIRGALLHDIGKIGSNLTLLNKSLAVIFTKFSIPSFLLPPFLKKALYYKNHHPQLGYELLLPLQVEKEVLNLVKYHHQNAKIDDEHLLLLQYFDNLF